jgi:branched-chain amino acid transport system substrate-binding protein
MLLDAAQGLVLAETFYWAMNDRTRTFTSRVVKATGGVIPNASQAACYASVLHYLKTAAAMGAATAKQSGAATVARMKQMPIDDDVIGKASIRVDGRVEQMGYLFEVKAPGASTKPWDYYKLLASLPPGEAFRPLAEGGCPLVKAG